MLKLLLSVVYLSIPTSNHNYCLLSISSGSVVYLSIPTSNHNWLTVGVVGALVVYLSIPTSNHNHVTCVLVLPLLFICLFLHQTTTRFRCLPYACGCLSVYSYIKPQLCVRVLNLRRVVYLSIPTSNHNYAIIFIYKSKLFICLFLHQTTTSFFIHFNRVCCLSVYSYIKPQPVSCFFRAFCSCLSVYSYIKPQPLASPTPSLAVVYLSIPTSNHNLGIL